MFHHMGRKAVRDAASVIVLGLLGSLAGCGGNGGSGDATTLPPNNTPTLQSIEITPSLKQAAAGTTDLFVCTINLGEVLYRLVHVEGAAAAHRHVAEFRSGPLEVVQAREPLVMAAAELKGSYPLSYADAFAVATDLKSSPMRDWTWSTPFC